MSNKSNYSGLQSSSNLTPVGAVTVTQSKVKQKFVSLSDIYFTIKSGLRAHAESGRTLKDYMYLLDSIDLTNPELMTYIALDTRSYYRASVLRDSDLEMAIITWRVGQESGLHGHPGDCIFKLLRGTLNEEIFSRKKIQRKVINEGDTRFINNDIGYHNVKNNGNSYAVSIHIYSPSFTID